MSLIRFCWQLTAIGNSTPGSGWFGWSGGRVISYPSAVPLVGHRKSWTPKSCKLRKCRESATTTERLGTRSEKKWDYMGKIPKWQAPPPPVWETPVIKKKVGFIFHFRTSGTFLVFTKKSPFWVIDWNYVVGIGEPPLRDARFLHFPQKEIIVKC